MNRLALLALLAIAGCTRPAIESSSTNNREFTVETLFTKDGCTVYRFLDGNYRYFTRCEVGSRSQVEWVEACGKGCTRPVSVSTN